VPPGETTETLKVLVVDDEDEVRTLMVRALRAAGHRVSEASTLIAAKELAESRTFDALVSDVVLGEDDGLTLIEFFHEQHPRARVIVVSGYSPSPERFGAPVRRWHGFEQRWVQSLTSTSSSIRKSADHARSRWARAVQCRRRWHTPPWQKDAHRPSPYREKRVRPCRLFGPAAISAGASSVRARV
jgi:DNA-binding NtrC family response regulator